MIIDPSYEWRRDEVKVVCAGKQVIDIGGAMHHWLEPKPYACADIQKSNCELNFVGDLSMPTIWNDLIAHVAGHGKFDYAICTHVLEDVRNPPMILESLPAIACEGFISMPSKHAELGKGECDADETRAQMGIREAYRGYIHHRWIFDMEDDTLKIFPKLPAIEVMDGIDLTPQNTELSFYWEDDIPYKMFQDDWLGPNPWDLINNYRKELMR